MADFRQAGHYHTPDSVFKEYLAGYSCLIHVHPFITSCPSLDPFCPLFRILSLPAPFLAATESPGCVSFGFARKYLFNELNISMNNFTIIFK